MSIESIEYVASYGIRLILISFKDDSDMIRSK